MTECFRCKKNEPDTNGRRLHRLHVSCGAWNKVLLTCADCVQWFQNMLREAEVKGIQTNEQNRYD